MASPFINRIIQELGFTPAHIEQAKHLAREKNIQFIHALEALKVVDAVKLFTVFSECHGIQFANLDGMDIHDNIINLIPKDVAMKSRVIPIDRVGNHIIIAMENPNDLKTIDLIRFKTGYSAKPVIAPEEAISNALRKYYSIRGLDVPSGDTKANMPKNTGDMQVERSIINDSAPSSEEDGPIVKLVNQILLLCFAKKASDIHIEAYEKFMRIRLRIDGVLHEVVRPPVEYKASLTTRIKIMANMNIAEKRKPQDGGIRVEINGRPIDFRASALPTIYGEKIVLRILDKSSLNVDLTKLGFEQDDFDKFKESISRPYGMVLVTGPTGSGKTTTLYSALAELNKSTDNIVTAEDPVEYNIEGINQVQVNPQIEFGFAEALKSFLRQDPDVIMVGEIRDIETGEIAMKAALTGHLVLSTLHTNTAPDTVVRLQNMGLETFNLISALNSIVAQRLARKICTKCRIVDESITPEILIDIGLHPQYAQRVKAYKGRGCSACSNSGYAGRMAVHEVMVINDPIREAMMRGAPAMELKKIAVAHGMRTLRQNAINKMIRGEIDVAEVVGNTGSDTEKSTKISAA